MYADSVSTIGKIWIYECLYFYNSTDLFSPQYPNNWLADVYADRSLNLDKSGWRCIYTRLPLPTVFLCPRDDSQGALRFALSVRLSVCPSVFHGLRYRVCVINFSHSFLWIFLKSCIPVVDILKMCLWIFGGARINFDGITAFRT